MNGENAAYAIRRSARARRPRLMLDESGRATVVLPLRAPGRLAAELVATHAGWLDRHRRRLEHEQELLAARPPLEGGRQIVIGGVRHSVEVEHAPAGGRRSRVIVSSGPSGAIVRLRLAPGDARPAAHLLEGWLRSEARRVLEASVRDRAAQFGLSAPGIAVRDQRSRWASASGRGSLSFSWRLLLCPPWVLDYVVVHELAHLRVAGHGPGFWQLVERHVSSPLPQEARRWLRTNRLAVLRALD